jgi:hypothetical protein
MKAVVPGATWIMVSKILTSTREINKLPDKLTSKLHTPANFSFFLIHLSGLFQL